MDPLVAGLIGGVIGIMVGIIVILAVQQNHPSSRQVREVTFRETRPHDDERRDREPRRRQTIRCHRCNQRFDSKNQLKKHKRREHGRPSELRSRHPELDEDEIPHGHREHAESL